MSDFGPHSPARAQLGAENQAMVYSDRMFSSCLAKQEALVERFAECKTPEQRYQKIIELGREQGDFPDEDRSEANRVRGCQSRMYLSTRVDDGKMYFQTESDALISAGLGQLLVAVYSGEPAEAVLKCPPNFLEELGVVASLTPGRANGLASLHLRMRQEALASLSGQAPS